MNIVDYTAVFGPYDKPIVVPCRESHPDADVRYVCMTDGQFPQDVPGWEYVQPVGRPCSSLDRETRRAKALPHKLFPDADVSIWHGANFQLLVPPSVCVTWLGDSDMAVLKHPHRDCAYDEADVCAMMDSANAEAYERAKRHLEWESYPKHAGLAATTLLVRRHTPEIERFNALWWREIVGGTPRDQLYFNLACQKAGIVYNVIPGDLVTDPKWVWRPNG